MTREEAIAYWKQRSEHIHNWLEENEDVDFIGEYVEAIDMAIEALSKPNYESDNEVRLAVTDMNKDKVVLWDAFGEVEYYPHGEINCVNCPHYHETEDETGVHSHCKSHGRLIDADALSKKLCETTIFIKDGEVFQRMINDAPTIQADRPHGEWVFNPTDAIDLMFAKPKCSKCGFESSDGGNFCPNCGARMKGGAE